MKFESVYEKVQPQMLALARGQGGLITLAQMRRIIMYNFGNDERTIKRKLDMLVLFGKLEPDGEPGQYIVTDYKPKKALPNNGGSE